MPDAVPASAPATAGAEPAGKVDRSHKGAAAPTASFTGPDGKPTTLAAFAGRPTLVNLWATWCGPCKAEMPTLERLAGEGKVQVVTISQDLPTSSGRVGPYFAGAGFKALKQYLDPENGLSAAFGNPSLPTSVLYDARGKEVWRVVGGMDWTGAKARGLLAEAG